MNLLNRPFRLHLQARVATEMVSQIESRLDLPARSESVWVFVSYAESEVPVGTTFEVMFPEKAPSLPEEARLTLEVVTQQFFASWESIPQGWKTICRFAYEGTCPKLLESLPKEGAWEFSEQGLILVSSAPSHGEPPASEG